MFSRIRHRFYLRLFRAVRSLRFWLDTYLVGGFSSDRRGHGGYGALWFFQMWCIKRAGIAKREAA